MNIKNKFSEEKIYNTKQIPIKKFRQIPKNEINSQIMESTVIPKNETWRLKYISEPKDIKSIIKEENISSKCQWLITRTGQRNDGKVYMYSCSVDKCLAQLKLEEQKSMNDIDIVRKENNIKFDDIKFHSNENYSWKIKEIVNDLSVARATAKNLVNLSYKGIREDRRI